MAAMIFKSPPYCGQCSRSIPNTRLSRRAQPMRAGASCAWWAASAPGFCGVRGTIAARSLALARQRAVKTDQMQARTRHQRGQALYEFQRRHLDVRGAVAPGAFELLHDITSAIALEPFIGNRGARDVAAQPFEFLALMGATAHPAMQAEAVRIGAQSCADVAAFATFAAEPNSDLGRG